MVTAAQAYWLNRKRRRARNEGVGFTPRALFASGEAGAWYDPSDLTTLWQDSARTTPVTADGDPVGCIDDKSGNGNNATQANPVSRPLYKTSGGLHWLEGDGVDDFLRSLFTITQPWERVSAIRQVTWTSGDRIFGGAAATAGLLQQFTPSPDMRLFSGSGAAQVSSLAVGSDGVVTERHSGATSRLTVNNAAYATGDAGTTVPGGISIFAEQTGTGASNARCYGVTMRAGALTDAQITQLRNYYATKSGVTL